MMPAEMLTLRDVLRWAVSRFNEALLVAINDLGACSKGTFIMLKRRHCQR